MNLVSDAALKWDKWPRGSDPEGPASLPPASSRKMGGGTPGVLGRGRDSAGQSCCSFPVLSCSPLAPLFPTPLSSLLASAFFHFLAGVVSEPKVSGNCRFLRMSMLFLLLPFTVNALQRDLQIHSRAVGPERFGLLHLVCLEQVASSL